MRLATSILLLSLASTVDGQPFDVRDLADDRCVLNAFAQLLKRGDGMIGQMEAGAFLVRTESGMLAVQLWPHSHIAERAEFRGAIPTGTVAIAHTHPPTMEQPSRGDIQEATRLGLPVIVVSFWSISVVDPDSTRSTVFKKRWMWSVAAERNGCTPEIAELKKPTVRADLRRR